MQRSKLPAIAATLLMAAACSEPAQPANQATVDAPSPAPVPVDPNVYPSEIRGVALDKLGCSTGEERAADTHGQIQQWCELRGRRHGPFLSWNYEGEKLTEGLFEGGQQHGSWTWYHDDGTTIKAKGRYRRGRQVGNWTQWHSNGERAREGDFLEGRKSGIWTTWHTNGLKAEEGHYHNGMQNGVWSFWKEDGTLDRQETWQFGKRTEE